MNEVDGVSVGALVWRLRDERDDRVRPQRRDIAPVDEQRYQRGREAGAAWAAESASERALEQIARLAETRTTAWRVLPELAESLDAFFARERRDEESIEFGRFSIPNIERDDDPFVLGVLDAAAELWQRARRELATRQ